MNSKNQKPNKTESGKYTLRIRLNGESISITKPTAAECEQEAQRIKSEYLQNQGKQ